MVLNVFFLQVLISNTITAAPHQTAKGQSDPPNSKQFGLGIEIVTPREGVSFEPYLKEVYASIRQNWIKKIPQSAGKGEKGVVVVTVVISKDGAVPKQFPKIVRSSGQKDLDEAALTAVRSAAPFGHLPEAFAGPSVELQLVFWYNLPQPLSPSSISPVLPNLDTIRLGVTSGSSSGAC
jgi:TonB family protein